MAGVHVVVNFLIAVGAVALVFNIAEKWATGAALAVVEDDPCAYAGAGGAGIGQFQRAMAGVIFGSGVAIRVAEDVGAFDGAAVAIVVRLRRAIGDLVPLQACDPTQLTYRWFV